MLHTSVTGLTPGAISSDMCSPTHGHKMVHPTPDIGTIQSLGSQYSEFLPSFE